MMRAMTAALLLAVTGCCVSTTNPQDYTVTVVYVDPGSQPQTAGELGRATIPSGQTVQTALPVFTTEIDVFLIIDNNTTGPFGPFDVPRPPNCLGLTITTQSSGARGAGVAVGESCCN